MTENTPSATVPIVQPWENTASPFFLSSGDNPRVSLVVQHLTEENYNTWSRAILISLDAKTKLGFIDALFQSLKLSIIHITQHGINVTVQS